MKKLEDVGVANELFDNHRRRLASGTILVVVTVIVAVAISAFGIYKLRGHKNPLTFQNVKVEKLATTGEIVAVAISSDGKDFAYVTSEPSKERLWIKQVTDTGHEMEVVSGTEENFRGLKFSPDNNFIYYLRSSPGNPNTIFRVPSLGGLPVAIISDVDSTVTFSPDGQSMAYLRADPDRKKTSLMITQSDGRSERRLTTNNDLSRFVLNTGPSWSSDGKRIAVAATQSDSNLQHVLIVDVNDGTITSIDPARWQRIGSLAWLSDGNSFIVSGSDHESKGAQIWQVLYPSGQVQRITNDLTDYQQVTLTRNSRQILALQDGRQANIRNGPSGEQRPTQSTSGTANVVLLSGS